MNEPLKYLILSDSHGYLGRLQNVLMASEPEGPFAGVIHLGDGYADLNGFREHLPPVIQLAGNCDALYTTPDTPACRVEALGGLRVLLTHGHTLYVRSSTDALLTKARAEGAAAALYGFRQSAAHLPKPPVTIVVTGLRLVAEQIMAVLKGIAPEVMLDRLKAILLQKNIQRMADILPNLRLAYIQRCGSIQAD